MIHKLLENYNDKITINRTFFKDTWINTHYIMSEKELLEI